MKDTLDILSLKNLLEDVQLQHVFPDQKIFVDAVPRFSAEEIIQKYNTGKKNEKFDLRQFVSDNFIITEQTNNHYTTNISKGIVNHIHELWNVLTRQTANQYSTLIALPKSYIVPGGRFSEMYYWDSYFTMLGLKISGRMDLVQNMVDNFSYLLETAGHIPNGNRSYFLSRSQPPFYAYMIVLLQEEKGDEILKEYLPQLLIEYNYWMKGSDGLSEETPATKHIVRMPDGSLLNRYWDEENLPRPEGYAIDVSIRQRTKNNPELYRNIRAACESGWDFSSRWFADGANIETICTTEIIPVDLNCLLWNLETTIASAYNILNEKDKQNHFEQKAFIRKNAIDKYLWDNENAIYKDYNFVLQEHTSSVHLAMAYPLFTGIATENKAKSVLGFIEKNMLYTGGLVTTIKTTNQQWDFPKCWAPLQWIVFISALKYGKKDFAETIKKNWCATVEKEFLLSGKLLEKYNVENNSNKDAGGEYPNQDGFGWTNAVYLALKNKI
ncbi:MAG: alpha,alpha-trehalase TreF [Arachidicoccus sp.]|nr:alpha,alpha-trehalase TreF [Arachidicoccus sp.]